MIQTGTLTQLPLIISPLILTIYLQAEEHIGTYQIMVGNGAGLPIHHSGASRLLSISKKLYLQQILHVPSIKKKLLSISKFTHDNHVFFEFHPSYSCVKDLNTERLFLHRPTKDGLYTFSPSPSNAPLKYAFLCK